MLPPYPNFEMSSPDYGRPSIMELGAKSPAIVLPSADLKLAANNVRNFGFDSPV